MLPLPAVGSCVYRSRFEFKRIFCSRNVAFVRAVSGTIIFKRESVSRKSDWKAVRDPGGVSSPDGREKETLKTARVNKDARRAIGNSSKTQWETLWERAQKDVLQSRCLRYRCYYILYTRCLCSGRLQCFLRRGKKKPKIKREFSKISPLRSRIVQLMQSLTAELHSARRQPAYAFQTAAARQSTMINLP